MSEPTIDEMLEYLDGIHTQAVEYDADKYAAIFAVIKQHGDADITMRIASIEIEKECERQKREAIRAFVERVEKRWNSLSKEEWDALLKGGQSMVIAIYKTKIYAELAAMEKENG